MASAPHRRTKTKIEDDLIQTKDYKEIKSPKSPKRVSSRYGELKVHDNTIHTPITTIEVNKRFLKNTLSHSPTNPNLPNINSSLENTMSLEDQS